MNYFNRRKEEDLILCTLSGTNETGGRNSNFIEYKDNIIIIDAGFAFPDQDMYGIDYLIPNFSYLKKKKDKIKAILITHGHLDHTGALPYVLEELGFPPIYAGGFPLAWIKERLTEFGLEKKVKLIEITEKSILNFGQMKVSYLTNAHSIPDSFSMFIETPEGNIFFSGDYKIENPKTDMQALEKITGNVHVALVDSTNVYRPGKAKPETLAHDTLLKVISAHQGRVIVGAFASLVDRLLTLVDIAKKTNRKIYISGRSMLMILEIAKGEGLITVGPEMFIKERDLNSVEDNKIIMLITGSQAERYAAMNRIALGEHKYIKAKPTDLVILSASEVPGNESKIGKMTDDLIRQGVELVKGAEIDVHSGGHGLQDDMKIMYEVLRPKYIIPIHGSLTYRYHSKKLHTKWGHPKENVLLTEDGQTWKLSKGILRRGIKVESKPILIDGLGVGDIGDIVLKDRAQLSEFGMFIVVLNINYKDKRIMSKPRFVSRGFVYMKTSQQLLKEIDTICTDTHREWLEKWRSKQAKEQDLVDELEKRIKKYIYKKTQREPIILPVLI
ncbi:ribonuclease J [Candidatus Dojkabacteria bacterium]|nr:ribonuclease J [Candidatus Dojkabacteria bacterium]